MEFAPVAVFVYNRPEHTQQTIAALQKNALASETDLIVFSDAAKTSLQAPFVRTVRDFIRTVDGFKSVTIVERDENWGLSKSVIAGVTDVCERYGKVIVLEDDLIISPYFLNFMNDALDVYASEQDVISIHGYMYPVGKGLPETFFLRGADCWGWATWKRGWDLFEPDAQKLLDTLLASGQADTFDFGRNYDYTEMLLKQVEGKINSWAIRWYASAFLANKLTLYPGTSLVQNIGNDSSGTHCGNTDSFSGHIAEDPIEVGGIAIVPNPVAYQLVAEYFQRLRVSFAQRIKNRIKALWLRGARP